MSSFIDFVVMSSLYFMFVVGRYYYFRKKPRKLTVSYVEYKDMYNARRRWKTQNKTFESWVEQNPKVALTVVTLLLMVETFVVFAIII